MRGGEDWGCFAAHRSSISATHILLVVGFPRSGLDITANADVAEAVVWQASGVALVVRRN